MSHLDPPRVHFRGSISANVYTANNDDYGNPPFVDTAKVRVDTQGKTDADFATWLRELDPSFGIRAGWNLYGDGATLFNQTVVHSVQTVAGSVVTDSSVDPLVGATVQLSQAIMVDLDPKGTRSTQIFCESLHIQAPGGLSIVGRPTRFHSRWVLRRNLSAGGFSGYAAVWHAVIPPDRLTIAGNGSPVLALLQQAHANGKGLFIRFATYLLAPLISQQQLASDFAHNRPTENPAVGRVLGSLGVWQPGEMTTIPQGRRLVPGAALSANRADFQLNPATCAVDPATHRVSLDLINTFPEIDASLAKINIGDVKLHVDSITSGKSQLQPLGLVAYDRAAYEQTGGMIDLIYPAALDAEVQAGRLVLVQESSGSRLLEEAELTVETDDRCVYLDETQAGSLALRVLRKGASPGAPVTIRLAQYVTTNKSIIPADPANSVLNVAAQVETDANGTAVVPLTTVRPGTCFLAFLPPDTSDGDISAFANIRVLPKDDYSAVPDAQVTFAFIYDEVLRYYYLLYPKMNRIFDLSREDRVTQRAQFVRDRVAADQFDHAAYMPRTRELSAGKRLLLQRWCDLILAAGGQT